MNRILLAMSCQALIALTAFNVAAQQINKPIKDIAESAIVIKGERHSIPKHYRTLQIDITAMKQLLTQSPAESPSAARSSNVIFEMPMPGGSNSRFRIYETQVMDTALAAQFPEIKTYAGQGIDDVNATIRLDITPLGFHAMVLSPNGSVFIDPYCQNTTTDYICYYKKDLTPSGNFVCETHPDNNVDNYRSLIPANLYAQKSAGNQLRTYRLALACTGEYASTKGGTVSGAMAGITTSMNRVNGVYESEVAVRMVLIANNSSIVYTNSATDPYTNNSGGTMLGQNQSNLDAVIGSANYDIGHVFSTGGGGIAGLGVVCSNGNKARGVTGSPSPVGDAFDIDYVAHEIGHQFGGNHTFNSSTGNCSGGNRASSAAYEPGSGITIMAYAGICGSDDLDAHSIAYFHTKSFDEIVNYTTTGTGNTCPVTTNTGNNPPVASVGGDFIIPISTPFILTGSATDADGDPLTYSWEQYDLGAASTWNAMQTAGSTWPLFRPFPPVTSPSRTFPKLSDIINNTTTVGEVLPTVARTMHFRLTARDNRSGGSGVMHPDLTNNITVVNSGGAFVVTAPNTTVTWAGNSVQTVTWNVSGTNGVPINCTNVKISLSTDGGNTFPTVVAASTLNDGSESITVPNNATTQARIKVEALGNIFFDMSNANFTITAGSSLTTITTSAISPTSYCQGAAVSVPFTTNGPANAGNVFTAQLSNAAGSFASPVNIGTLNSTSAGTIMATIPAGTIAGNGYRIRVVSSNPMVTGSDNGVNITVNPNPTPSISGNTSFCQGSSTQLCAPVGFVSYIWSTGATTQCITVNTANTFSVTVTNSDGCSGSTSTATTINPNPTPSISGNTPFCQGSSTQLCATAGFVSYIWSTGATTQCISVNTANTFSVTVTNSDGCSGSTSTATTINTNPTPFISGNTSFCQGSSTQLCATAGFVSYMWSTGATTQCITVNTANTFSVTVTNGDGCNGSTSASTTINPLPNVSFTGLASSYNVNDPSATLTGSPSGGTFTGPGISGNTFTPSSAGVGGPYTITYLFTDGNGCSNSSSHQTTVTNCTPPARPGNISTTGGAAKVCSGDTKTYSVAVVSGATFYTWTAPAGGNIINGQGTRVVTINYTSGFTANDSLRVVAGNACGTGASRALLISRNVPATPGAIMGQTYGVCNLTGVPYSVNNVSGMTYNWTWSVASATIASGQGTNAVTSDFSPNFNTNGIIRVSATNACGTSSQRTLTVRAVPATPASINGSTSVCANQQGVSYSTAAIPFATNYTWTAPTGASINDGTLPLNNPLVTTATSVTINFATTSGNVRVRANNSCGSSTYRALAVTFVCRDGEQFSGDDLNLACYPMPATDQLNVVFSSATAQTNSISIFDLVSKRLLHQTNNSVAGENKFVIDLSTIASGIYMLEVVNGDKRSLERIVIE